MEVFGFLIRGQVDLSDELLKILHFQDELYSTMPLEPLISLYFVFKAPHSFIIYLFFLSSLHQ